MDPNANLKEQRIIVARIIADEYPIASDHTRDAARLADLVEAQDGWLSRGGFLPSAWAVSK